MISKDDSSLDRVPTRTPAPRPARSRPARLADVRRRQTPLRLELLQKVHRGVEPLLLDLLELTKLKGPVLRDPRVISAAAWVENG